MTQRAEGRLAGYAYLAYIVFAMSAAVDLHAAEFSVAPVERAGAACGIGYREVGL